MCCHTIRMSPLRTTRILRAERKKKVHGHHPLPEKAPIHRGRGGARVHGRLGNAPPESLLKRQPRQKQPAASWQIDENRIKIAILGMPGWLSQ